MGGPRLGSVHDSLRGPTVHGGHSGPQRSTAVHGLAASFSFSTSYGIAMDADYEDLDAFWPDYLAEHAHPGNRALHVTGTLLALGCVAAAAVKREPKWLLAAPLVGYGCAWVGHFLVEKNKPATFQHPVKSFLGDLRLLQRTLRGTLDEDLEAHGLRKG